MAVRSNKSIFYHVPRTGGMWVKEAMKTAGIEYRDVSPRKWRHPLAPMIHFTHTTPECIAEKYKKGLYSFCFVRQPVDWYRSYWCINLKLKSRGRTKLDELLRKPFEEWVNDVLNKYPDGYVSQLYKYFVFDVDYVGSYYRLQDDLVTALNNAGETFDLQLLLGTPPVNTAASEKEYSAKANATQATYDRIIETERWAVDFVSSL